MATKHLHGYRNRLQGVHYNQKNHVIVANYSIENNYWQRVGYNYPMLRHQAQYVDCHHLYRDHKMN